MKKKIIRIKFKRRRLGLTDYKKRKIFVISEKPRFVVRISNKYILIQIINANIKGDVCLVSVHSSILNKLGWKFSCKNIPACYLSGYIVGKKALEKNIKEAVLDIGLKTPSKFSRIFAAVKGAIDAGLKIPVSSEVIPSKERIEGKHIADYAHFLKSQNEELYKSRFSGYLRKDIYPEKFVEYFNKFKTIIIKKFGENYGYK